MKLLKKLQNHRPKEVYVSLVLLYFLLFLNSSELLTSRIRFGDIFDIKHSVVYGIIRGIGDNHIRSDAIFILYCVLAVLFVVIGLAKSRKISNWLWDNT